MFRVSPLFYHHPTWRPARFPAGLLRGPASATFTYFLNCQGWSLH